MSINLVTYANQTVTPTNDAIIYERAIDQNGIFYGCNVTVSGNAVNITGGYGIVCGREFVIESESIPVTLAPSGTLDGRLYVRLDLADIDAPIQLLTAQGGTLPPLEQDNDVNYTNGTYEMELATFTVGVSALSDVVETFETIYGVKELIKADYVVEQGTSGSWTYRKWNSGTYECWLRTANGSAATINFPITFVELPRILATSGSTAAASNYGSVNVFTRGTTTAKTDISFESNVASTNIWADVYVIGRWK